MEWRKNKYSPQIELENNSYLLKNKKESSSNYNKAYVKFTVKNLINGTESSAIQNIYTGKTYVGDDVWRMSNKADFCEYPIIVFSNMKEMSKDWMPLT